MPRSTPMMQKPEGSGAQAPLGLRWPSGPPWARGGGFTRKAIVGIVLMLLLGCQSDFARQEPVRPLAPGDDFPDVAMASPDPPEARAYLGLGDAKTFTLGDLDADVVYIEVLNTHCFSCKKQARANTRLFDAIAADRATRGRIKMLGVAVGNTAGEVAAFKKAYRIVFPIVADPDFDLHRAVGYPKTPYTFYVRMHPGGTGRIAKTHLGALLDPEEIFGQLSALLSADLSARPDAGTSGQTEQNGPRRRVDEDQVKETLRAAAAARGGTLVHLTAIDAPTRGTIYVAKIENGAQAERLFAVSEYRTVPCDVCKDAHFIYLFDETGKIVAFEPVQLSKYDNLPWDDADMALIRSRIVGKHMFHPMVYDRQVDAVSSATITTQVIYDSFSDGRRIYQLLEAGGYLKKP